VCVCVCVCVCVFVCVCERERERERERDRERESDKRGLATGAIRERVTVLSTYTRTHTHTHTHMPCTHNVCRADKQNSYAHPRPVGSGFHSPRGHLFFFIVIILTALVDTSFFSLFFNVINFHSPRTPLFFHLFCSIVISYSRPALITCIVLTKNAHTHTHTHTHTHIHTHSAVTQEKWVKRDDVMIR